jgi:DNA-binding response OmpR family regulator
MHVLLIDDDIEEHSLFELALRRINVESEYFVAATCHEALELIVAKSIPPPDFIFLDIDTPAIDGKGCLSMFEAQNPAGKITVVLYSTLEHLQDLTNMIRHGALFYLDKSRSFTKFCNELKAILTSQSAA